MSSHNRGNEIFAYLEKQVVDGTWAQGERLPTILALSRQLHVNIHTVGSVIKTLEAKGLITIVHRKGIFSGSNLPAASSPRPPKKRACMWREIRTRLEHDIHSGVFKNSLPDNKVLQNTYRVCYHTIRKAVKALVDDRVLWYDKNRYYISLNGHTPYQTSILSLSGIHYSVISSTISIHNDFFKFGMATLELTCMSKNIHFVKKSMGPDNYIRVILDNVTSDSHFGYIVWTTGLSTVQRIALVEALAPLHKPVAFIDDAWNFLLPEQYAKYPHFRIFLPASYLSGKCVARYLLRNGHTKGAFISYNQHQKWARVRLEAITQSFTDAGFIDGVLPIISDGDNGIPDAFVNKVRRELTEKFPAAAFWYIPALQLAGLEWSQHVYTHILGGDLFPRALQDTTITAWICENDFVALAAMHYLKTTQPPHVQNRIAIIGFDDLPAATENDLTSYNFAPSLIMEKAVGFLINPQQEFFKDKMRIEVEGVLIERGSTIQ